MSKQVKLASPTSFHSEGQVKGKTPKQGLQFVVAGQLECSISDSTQNIFPQIDECRSSGGQCSDK